MDKNGRPNQSQGGDPGIGQRKWVVGLDLCGLMDEGKVVFKLLRPPYEDEHICLKVLVLFGVDICRKLEGQITELELTIQAKYPVHTLALVFPKNSA